ncbi:MAG: FAD-binding protein, partial [Georgfuchsia sp.]
CVIDDPILVENADAIAWDDTADVVVAGFGGAGATAAIEARENGADVLILDRFEGGGATAYSGGVYYAGGTRYQRDGGYEDNADEMFKYLSIETRNAVSAETLRRFCEESSDTIDWLASHGVPFEGSVYPKKTNMPPNGKFLYYSGNEKVPAYAEKAIPAPRGHCTVSKPDEGGLTYFAALRKAALAQGVRIQTHSRVIRLIRDAAGRVIGVEALTLTDPSAQARHQTLYEKVNPVRPFNGARAEQAIAESRALEVASGKRRRIRARGGVILATGGYAYNLPMIAKHLPFLAEAYTSIMRLGSMGCDGSGIQLGQSVGGMTAKMQRGFVGRLITPPEALVHGLVVNTRGERFINEDIYNSVLGDAVMAQPDGIAWLVMDNELFWKMLRQLLLHSEGTFRRYGAPILLNLLFGGTRKGTTIAKLESACGMTAGVLEKSIATVNAACMQGTPDPLGKNPDYLHLFGKGPYRALNISITNKFAFTLFFTLGGLRVEETRGIVLTEDGTPIEGLYAAGRTAVGVCSDGYFSGMSLSDGAFSGRRAGRDAARMVVPGNHL